MWCDRKFRRQAVETMHRVDDSLRVDTILSGKLRRYHSLSLWKQLLRFRTIVLPNIRDGFLIAGGTVQSFVKLIAWRPDVIFCKGGFVCLPVGLAARVLRIPVVLHDSDAHPGLTNRILSRWARAIGTGAPLENYPYPETIARHVGIPVDDRFRKYSAKERQAFKQALGFDDSRPLIVLTGGGLGAHSINNATAAVLDDLLRFTNVLLISGTHQHREIAQKTAGHDATKFQLHAFVGKKIVETLAAADLVVARAGATTLLELAALAKPSILVPNPYLTAGHQIKNAEVLVRESAGVILEDTSLVEMPNKLVDTVSALIMNPDELKRMSRAIHSFAKPHAASDMAEMILAAGTSR